ncbi:large ribosomal subunit protein mL63 [Centruroides vittatus]|uniref:large ribosomal subunit protein mL63 n=1 Tax=Centruroides vittatus TaxID=120091 RepID=UPI00350FED6C
MFITNILYRNVFSFNRRIPGHLYRGKIRIVPPVTNKRKCVMWKEMLLEEENIMYLSNPYLTEEQEKGYMEALGKEEFWHYMLVKEKKFLENRFIEDHLSHMNVTRCWE